MHELGHGVNILHTAPISQVAGFVAIVIDVELVEEVESVSQKQPFFYGISVTSR